MPSRNVDLTDHLNSFIEAGIISGRFADASEAVREGLSLLEQSEQEDAEEDEQAKLAWLRSAAKEGFDAIDRGDYTVLHSPEEVSSFIRQLGAKSDPAE